MVNGCLLAAGRTELFAGCKVKTGRFCPLRGRSQKPKHLFARVFRHWHGFCTFDPAAAWEKSGNGCEAAGGRHPFGA